MVTLNKKGIEMAIKFAKDIIEQINARGPITVSDDCVTGEAFERWLINNKSSKVVGVEITLATGKEKQ